MTASSREDTLTPHRGPGHYFERPNRHTGKETITKLYMHPISMTSGPVRLFIGESGIDVEEQAVNLFAGAHHQSLCVLINPNRLVPVLESEDFQLTESSVILKHLAAKIDSPTYPKGLQARVKINEIMDWLATNFYRDYAYGCIYQQIFPHTGGRATRSRSETAAWGKERAQVWLQTHNDHWLGDGRAYLCGEAISIADYFGIAPLDGLSELVED